MAAATMVEGPAERSIAADMAFKNQLHQSSAVPASSPKPMKETQMPNLDSFAAKLNNFAVVLSEKAKPCPVTVGDIAEIENALDLKKVKNHLLLCNLVTLNTENNMSFII